MLLSSDTICAHVFVLAVPRYTCSCLEMCEVALTADKACAYTILVVNVSRNTWFLVREIQCPLHSPIRLAQQQQNSAQQQDCLLLRKHHRLHRACVSHQVGIASLVWGPASDRYGRRLVYLASFVAFAGSTVGCIFAPTVEVLVAFRALQGAGGGRAGGWCNQAAQCCTATRVPC